MADPLVAATGWGWRHAGRRAAAVSGLDLRIDAGERVLLLGPSGAGKSTLLAALAGVLGGDEDGQAAGELLLAGRRPLEARGVAGLVLQDPDAQMIMARAGDDTAFGPENLALPREEIWRRVAQAQRAVGLHLDAARETHRLSGGQKQRLALAGVLAMRPELLLLDEPTANLDPEGAIEVRDAVAAVLRETGATAVIVEHRVELWWQLATRVVVLDPAGGLIADTTPERAAGELAAELSARGVRLPGQRLAAESAERAAREMPGDADGRAPSHDAGRSAALLSARGLAVARQRGTTVQAGIDVDLAAGEVLAITGPNGAGKSTLALTLAGLLPPEGGDLLAHPDLADGAAAAPWRWRSRQLLTRIGAVFQNPEHQFLGSTVRAELAIGPTELRLPRAEIDARVGELLERLHLAALAGASPFSLSGGQKRRLSVATALATRPRILVLDEPTFGQDATGWRELVALLDEVRASGSAVVAVTHDRELIATLGARELRLDGGVDAVQTAATGARS
ncbi:ATP-binding cassette domain-containing protein [Schumannella luteola]|uniref:Energy-coupling factor transport system ATP-binding protein n=1 Tax=Schumannella luteola TaxID=472059 RepID=A0A852YT50_9MICO|nr:energy-coupling factor transport system ATP-binding protein [Schumannella luteola]